MNFERDIVRKSFIFTLYILQLLMQLYSKDIKWFKIENTIATKLEWCVFYGMVKIGSQNIYEIILYECLIIIYDLCHNYLSILNYFYVSIFHMLIRQISYESVIGKYKYAYMLILDRTRTITQKPTTDKYDTLNPARHDYKKRQCATDFIHTCQNTKQVNTLKLLKLRCCKYATTLSDLNVATYCNAIIQSSTIIITYY